MNTFWINPGAPNSGGHEHATCTSTFDVVCYGTTYKEHEEVINFFDSVIRAYKMYPTFDILAAFALAFFVGLYNAYMMSLCYAELVLFRRTKGLIPCSSSKMRLELKQEPLPTSAARSMALPSTRSGISTTSKDLSNMVTSRLSILSHRRLATRLALIHYFKRTATSSPVVG